MNNNQILTVPKEEEYSPLYITGNEWVAIPEIDPKHGGINSINILSMESLGLIEFSGVDRPFIKPRVCINGLDIISNAHLNWSYKSYWIPSFKCEKEDYTIEGSICAPKDIKGFLYTISVYNNGCSQKKVEIGVEGYWKATYNTIFTPKLINGINRAFYNDWTNTIIMEINPWVPIGSIAMGCSEKLSSMLICDGRESSELPNTGKEGISFKSLKEIDVEPRKSFTISFYFGVNREGDGASTTCVDMKRIDYSTLETDTINWLNSKIVRLKDNKLEAILNKNLFFNYFFASGNTIDTEEIALVTSRSPKYYVSGAYWPRDTFLWSFNSVLIIDYIRAREQLVTGFKRHIKNAGVHSHYINGTVLYPGFELDQLVAYIIALDNYINYTKDYKILKNDKIVKGIKKIYKTLIEVKGEDISLFKTFLDPSDDPVEYPYLIYNNCLVWAALKIIDKINDRRKIINDNNIIVMIENLEADISKHGIVDGPYGRMFCYSTDGKGKYKLYDNPPGSLLLLPYYGFCSLTDQVFVNTVRWIMSEENPYFTQNEFSGMGCIHAKSPWIMAYSNCLLANIDMTHFIKLAEMDNYFACETINSSTGKAKTGRAFATFAGFLAYSIYYYQGNFTRDQEVGREGYI